MFIGWLTCISRSLLPHFLCRSTTGNTSADRQMPIALAVSGHAWATDENLKLTAKNEQTKTQFIIKRTDNKFNFGEI
jgi:hypothetical protein